MNQKNYLKKKAFTIIELLVVVATLGLLASIVLVSIEDSKKNAQHAVVLEFSSTIRRALGAYSFARYDFNEGVDNTCLSGKDVCDKSGNNHDAEWINGGSWIDNDIGLSLKKAVSFDEFSCLEIDNFKGKREGSLEGFTVQFWVKPKTSIARGTIYELRTPSGGLVSYAVFANGGKLIFGLAGAGGFTVEVEEHYFEQNQWHHIVLTPEKSTGKIKAFVNGKEVKSVDILAPWAMGFDDGVIEDWL